MKFIRGDSQKYSFYRYDTNGDVILATPHAIYFTVKTSFDKKDFVIQKTISDFVINDDGKYIFSIDPADTNDLKYGKYVYDIEVIQDSQASYKKTIKRGEFVLLGESTWQINETEDN